jgi:hypothetical protein
MRRFFLRYVFPDLKITNCRVPISPDQSGPVLSNNGDEVTKLKAAHCK